MPFFIKDTLEKFFLILDNPLKILTLFLQKLSGKYMISTPLKRFVHPLYGKNEIAWNGKSNKQLGRLC